MHVSFANIPFQIIIEGEHPNYFHWIYSYKDRYSSDCNSRLFFSQKKSILIQGKDIYSERFIYWKKNKGKYNIFIFNKEKNKFTGSLTTEQEWKDINITRTPEASERIFKTLTEIAFRTRILFFNGFVIHASAIKYKGHGIAFSAPSGTGKSTQAGLWETHKDALVLNSDRPAIRITETEAMISGTPWSGKSAKNINQSAPLKAIIFLEQSPNNSIRKLNPKEYLQRTMARSYLPYFDETLMQQAISNIAAIMPKVPAYLLQCRPDKEAVETVLQKLNL